MTLKKSLLIGLMGAMALPSLAQKLELSSAIIERNKRKNVVKAKEYIDKANTKLENGGTLKSKDLAKFWHYKGLIYLGTFSADSNLSNLDIAAEAFNKDLEMESPFNKANSKNNILYISNQYINSAFNASESKNYEASSRYFERVVELKKSFGIDTTNLNNACIMSNKTGGYARTIELSERLITLEPTKEAYHLTKLKAYSKLGDNANYIKALEKSKTECVDCQGIILEEVNFYIGTGEDEKLIASLDKAIESSPENATLYYIKGFSLGKLGNKAEAKNAYKKSIELDPKGADSYVNISGLYMKEANDVIEKMNDLGFSSADQAKHKKLKTERKAIYSEALPYLEKALELDEKNSSIASALMTVYYDLGNTDKWKETKAIYNSLKK